MSQPGFFFYTGDWLKKTRSLDPFSRGLWVDALCLLNEYAGSITWPLPNLASFLGVDTQQCHAFVTLLSRLNVADVTLLNNGVVTLTSRRMVRDNKARESNRLRQQRARDRQGRHRKVTGDVTPLSHRPSESESFSESEKEKEIQLECNSNKLIPEVIHNLDNNRNGTAETQNQIDQENEVKRLKRLNGMIGPEDQDEKEEV